MSTPPVLVINLDRSPDRLSAINEHLTARGIAYQRITAVDGTQIDLNKYADADLYRRCHGRNLRASEVGCYVSHLKAMSHFLETAQPCCVILEDDARLAADFTAIVSELVDRKLYGFDMLRLQGRRQGLGITSIRNERWRIKVHATRVTGSTGYILNRKAAQRYLERLLPMAVPYDHAFDRALHLRLRLGAVLPYPVDFAGVNSTIETTRSESRIGKVKGISRWPVLAWRTETEVARALACISEVARPNWTHIGKQ